MSKISPPAEGNLWEWARQTLASSRDPLGQGKALENNTRLQYRAQHNGKPPRYAVILHSTDVVTYRPDGSQELQSGGWRTVTTKDRMNRYARGRVFSDRGHWHVGQGWRRTDPDAVPYFDGIVLDTNGRVTNAPKPKDAERMARAQREIDRLVRGYIKGFVAHIREHGLEEPSGGDCWGCAMHPVGDDNTVKASWQSGTSRVFRHADIMGLDHYLSHFGGTEEQSEPYFVPSLLMNAIRERGYRDPGFIWWHIQQDAKREKGNYHAENALRQFFRIRKPKLAELLAAQKAAR